jgi:uncharacterized membrane protein (Fun14 family)
MITTTDIAPFAGIVGGGFFLGFISGYAIKKVLRLAAIIIGLLVIALAYLEYQRILNVDWIRIQVVSQNGTCLVCISSNPFTHHFSQIFHIVSMYLLYFI